MSNVPKMTPGFKSLLGHVPEVAPTVAHILADEAGLWQFRLFPQLWRNPELQQLKQLRWNQILFSNNLSAADVSRVPKNPGIYYFLVSGCNDVFPDHTYIFYAGKAAKGLRSRLLDYVQKREGEEPENDRPKIVKFLRYFDGHLHFVFAEAEREHVEALESAFKDNNNAPSQHYFEAKRQACLVKTTNYAALKCQMGKWQYYLCRMSFQDAVDYLKFAEEVNPSPELDEILQRDLSDRASSIRAFLEQNEERFFGSLIVAVYGGSPRFTPIHLEGQEFLSEATEGIGLLQFDGRERYYVLDGQHRLAAMRTVVQNNPDRYSTDQVSIILVSHTDDVQGIQQARRLFTNVNRYAVKTSKAANIVIEEDDAVAILTRRLLREDLFFQRVVRTTRVSKGQRLLVTGEALRPGADRHVLMNLPTFYDCNDRLIRSAVKAEELQPQLRPPEEVLVRLMSMLVDRWQLIRESFLPQPVGDDGGPEFDRNSETGGPYLFRPIGQKAACSAVDDALAKGCDVQRIKTALEYRPYLNQAPWSGLLWNSEDGSMMARKENIDLASRILSWWMGVDDSQQEIQSALSVISLGTTTLDPMP